MVRQLVTFIHVDRDRSIENNQINQRNEANLLGVDNFVKMFKNVICMYV